MSGFKYYLGQNSLGYPEQSYLQFVGGDTSILESHDPIIIEKGSPKKGIKELRYIDPTKLRKVKEIEEKQDPKTGAKLIEKVDEFFLFQDKTMNGAEQGLKIYIFKFYY